VLHIIFSRPSESATVYLPNDFHYVMAASGDAWGSKYGTDGPIPPGHYMLTGQVDHYDPPIPSEGFGQIYVADLSSTALHHLVDAKRASMRGTQVDIGGITLPLGGLAQWNRSEIMCHSGGSNAANPYDDYQPLLKTYGCTRMHSIDWKRLARDVEQFRNGHTLVFSVIGDPKPLAD